MIDFAGRTAFVTGGANGVGIGMVRNLLEAGAKVAIADIRQDSIDRALATLDNREVMGVQLNVPDRAGIRRGGRRGRGQVRPGQPAVQQRRDQPLPADRGQLATTTGTGCSASTSAG